jgi:hypothetical protein
MYKLSIDAGSRNHCQRRKAKRIAHSECVSVALDTQPTKRKHSILLSSEACPTIPYFRTLSHNRQDFRGKKVIEHATYVLIKIT